ncbi:GNAT family N-acetyltransferase [Asticcacaulis solisilvae]|nr:N-acetyltransferase [Asticcacaulis solisilvae]MDR6802892.1 ribosomal protein S18 acetylase RimI-like enzyme [Asticcacaulis sp. BE141]
MTLLSVTPDLVPALSALAIDSFTETFGHLYPPEDLEAFLRKSYAHDALLADINDPAQHWRVVLDDRGAAVAFMQCGKVGLPHPDARPDFEGELKRLYVHSSQQGKGLGKTLLSAAIDHMTERFGDAPQWIGVWSENHKAQAFYGSFGFHRVGEYQFAVGQTLDDEFILRRIPIGG